MWDLSTTSSTYIPYKYIILYYIHLYPPVGGNYGIFLLLRGGTTTTLASTHFVRSFGKLHIDGKRTNPSGPCSWCLKSSCRASQPGPQVQSKRETSMHHMQSHVSVHAGVSPDLDWACSSPNTSKPFPSQEHKQPFFFC